MATGQHGRYRYQRREQKRVTKSGGVGRLRRRWRKVGIGPVEHDAGLSRRWQEQMMDGERTRGAGSRTFSTRVHGGGQGREGTRKARQKQNNGLGTAGDGLASANAKEKEERP